jgi:hypothetical protein
MKCQNIFLQFVFVAYPFRMTFTQTINLLNYTGKRLITVDVVKTRRANAFASFLEKKNNTMAKSILVKSVRVHLRGPA